MNQGADRKARGLVPRVHGVTTNGYTNYACRCDECKAAWAAYCKRRRAERSANVPTGIHGRRNTYLNHGCRCVLCRTAAKARNPAQTPPPVTRPT